MINEVKVLNDDALREIEARYEQATPGPWTTTPGTFWICDVGSGDCGVWSTAYPAQGEPFPFAEQQADAEFLAHAREDIPTLCATVRVLRAENVRMDDELDRWRCRRSTCLAHDNVLVSYQYECPLCAVYTSDAENTDLREQLARCEGSRRVHELDNHHNALACGYCAGPIKEEITRLQSQLAQVTQERDDAREKLKHKTRELVYERGKCHP